MDNSVLEKVKEMLLNAANKMNVQLVSVKYYYSQEYDSNILEVMIDDNFAITMKQIDDYTAIVSPLLDEIEELSEPYMLDICSGGSEREIKEKDLNKFIDQYLEFKLKDNGEKVTAKLESYDEKSSEIIYTYFIKGRKKKESHKLDEIESIHMGYKK